MKFKRQASIFIHKAVLKIWQAEIRFSQNLYGFSLLNWSQANFGIDANLKPGKVHPVSHRERQREKEIEREREKVNKN